MNRLRIPPGQALSLPSEIAFHSILPSLAALCAQSYSGAIPSPSLFILPTERRDCRSALRLFGIRRGCWQVVGNHSVELANRGVPETRRVPNNRATWQRVRDSKRPLTIQIKFVPDSENTVDTL